MRLFGQLFEPALSWHYRAEYREQSYTAIFQALAATDAVLLPVYSSLAVGYGRYDRQGTAAHDDRSAVVVRSSGSPQFLGISDGAWPIPERHYPGIYGHHRSP